MNEGSFKRPRGLLAVIVGAQLAGTSLWFAGNALLPQLQEELQLTGSVTGVTAAVQLGFIAGTAVIAISGLADRFQGRTVFLFSAIFGALANLAMLWSSNVWEISIGRFLVGVGLAGIYPIGMKVAASWYRKGLGSALGTLVGALVLGTALPHLIGSALPWRPTLVVISCLAVLGGVLLFVRVPDGPFLRRAPFRPRAIPTLMGIPAFRGAAIGYFGHMWELYTFWALVPVLISAREQLPDSELSFVVIAVGAIGCVGGGLLTRRFGSSRVAAVQLAISGTCCLLLPFALGLPDLWFVAFLVTWGIAVVGDSPQYSTLGARSAPPEWIGTGLTFVTSAGFAISVASLALAAWIDATTVTLTVLAIGPALGLLGLRSTSVSDQTP